MKQGTFEQLTPVNPDRLHEEIKAALGDKYISMDTGHKESREDKQPKILVRLTDDATNEDKTLVESILKTHDHTKLSAPQQKEKDCTDAFVHFMAFDFATLKGMKPAEQNPIIIHLLEDIQKLMHRVNNG